MAWLLFMDESGHDHKNTPMEARGGVAIRDRDLFNFGREMRHLEKRVFGAEMSSLGKADYEIKGASLLNRKIFKWANYQFKFTKKERQEAVKRFLTAPRHGRKETREEFCAWGRSQLELADSVFKLLQKYEARVFVSMIPRDVQPPPGFKRQSDLRKDHVFLFERYFNFLETQEEHGLIIMDETDKENDRKFVKRMTRYFTLTDPGQLRASRIVPSPFFVASDMVSGVQAADLCIYVANWGFRLPKWDVKGDRRQEIVQRYGGLLSKLEFKGEREDPETGKTYMSYGIVFVPDPYTSRQ